MGIRKQIRSGKTYYSVFMKHNGHRIERACGFDSEGWDDAKAQERLDALRAELQPKPQTPKQTTQAPIEKVVRADVMTFGSAFERYLDHASGHIKSWHDDRLRYHKWLKDSLGHMALGDIKLMHLEDVLDRMRATHLSVASLVHTMGIVSRVFNFCLQRELYEGVSPTTRLKIKKSDNARIKFLTKEQVDQLITTAPSEELSDLIEVLAYTGMRRSEVLGLTWDIIDLEKGVLHLLNTKSGRPRAVWLHDRVKAVLTRRKLSSSSGKVFSMTPGNLTRSFRRLVSALGFNDGVTDRRMLITAHSLRHSFASWNAEAGVPVVVLQSLLGHNTPTMSLRYSHASDSRLREAVASL
jgi:integrase